MAVEHYLQLDLAADSAAARDLQARVPREAAHPKISLTGDGDPGALSGNLTSEMNAWLSDHVARARSRALAAVESAAGAIRLKGNVAGICKQIEDDRLKRDRARRQADVSKVFFDTHRNRLQELASTRADYEGLQAQEGGREARVPSKLADYGVPALIMVPEFFMNVASFAKLAGVPAIGFGLSAVVALAIAVAAFMTGTYWKAYHWYMPHDDAEQRSKGLRRIGIAMTLLTISLAAVGYARFSMVMEQVEAATILGLTPPNVVAQTAGLLAGNLLVFAIGAAVTYLMHDENPAYAEKAAAYRKQEAEVEGLRRRELEAKLAAIGRDYQQKRNAMLAKAKQMDSLPDFLPIVDQISAIEGKDNEVVGALRNYQIALSDQLLTSDPDFHFSGPQSDRYAAHSAAVVSLAEFRALPLQLYRSN